VCVEEPTLNLNSFRVVKPEIRVLGVDDGGFVPRREGRVLVVGVVFRGGYWLDGVMHTYVAVDGFDATERISEMIRKSPHHEQLRIIILNGITFAGFNTVNIMELNNTTGLPVVAVTNEKPNLKRIREAMANLPNIEKRWKSVVDAGDVFEVIAGRSQARIYLHVVGLSIDDAAKIVRLTSTRGNVPEALRVAHLIASGISQPQLSDLLNYENV
jgi:endonuclease V-like protein UPF0215 family